MEQSNSIFISYRRIDWCLARLIRCSLIAHGYDVFLDVKNIGSGTFDTRILEEIGKRPYFLPILTPNSLDRCSEPGDWLYREIEYAIWSSRRIVPIMTQGFSFEVAKPRLIGWLPELPRHNGIVVSHEEFDGIMDRLCTDYLCPVEPPTALPIDVVDYLSLLRINPQTAREFANRAITRFHMEDINGAILDYTAAIHLEPYGDSAYLNYMNRGVVRTRQGDHASAIEDYNESIKLAPNVDQKAWPYLNRGIAWLEIGDGDAAIEDIDHALSISPRFAAAYYQRGKVHILKLEIASAIDDYNKAILFEPHAEYYHARAIAYIGIGEIDKAITDFETVLEFIPADQAQHTKEYIAKLRQNQTSSQ